MKLNELIRRLQELERTEGGEIEVLLHEDSLDEHNLQFVSAQQIEEEARNIKLIARAEYIQKWSNTLQIA